MTYQTPKSIHVFGFICKKVECIKKMLIVTVEQSKYWLLIGKPFTCVNGDL